jgi:hypothetical protein
MVARAIEGRAYAKKRKRRSKRRTKIKQPKTNYCAAWHGEKYIERDLTFAGKLTPPTNCPPASIDKVALCASAVVDWPLMQSASVASSTTPPERNMIAQAALAFPWPGL